MGMMETYFSWFLMFVFMLMSTCSEGYKFYVGGKEGWVAHPSEDYNQWAQRMRFQVNDTLLFKYNKSSDSVLIVTKENYNTCNTKDPITTLSEGNSEYKFYRSGPHYFISGNAQNCKLGQKLIVVVLAVRPKKSPPKPAPVPAPAPAPVVSPTPSPAPEPSASAPAPAPASASQSPAPAPSTADGPAPAQEKAAAPKVAGYSVGGMVLSVAIGVGVILGM